MCHLPTLPKCQSIVLQMSLHCPHKILTHHVYLTEQTNPYSPQGSFIVLQRLSERLNPHTRR
jgi:hypothetical protein